MKKIILLLLLMGSVMGSVNADYLELVDNAGQGKVNMAHCIGDGCYQIYRFYKGRVLTKAEKDGTDILFKNSKGFLFDKLKKVERIEKEYYNVSIPVYSNVTKEVTTIDNKTGKKAIKEVTEKKITGYKTERKSRDIVSEYSISSLRKTLGSMDVGDNLTIKVYANLGFGESIDIQPLYVNKDGFKIYERWAWLNSSWSYRKCLNITSYTENDTYLVIVGNDSDISSSAGYPEALRITQGKNTEIPFSNESDDATGYYGMRIIMNHTGIQNYCIYYGTDGVLKANYSDSLTWQPYTFNTRFRGEQLFHIIESWEDNFIDNNFGWSAGYNYPFSNTSSGTSIDGSYSLQMDESSSIATKYLSDITDFLYMEYFTYTDASSPSDTLQSTHGNVQGGDRGLLINAGWPTGDEWGYYDGSFITSGESIGNSVWDNHYFKYNNTNQKWIYIINNNINGDLDYRTDSFINVTGWFVGSGDPSFLIDLIGVSKNRFNFSKTRPTASVFGTEEILALPSLTDCYMNQSSIIQGSNITFYLNYTMGDFNLDTGWFYYNTTPKTKVDSTANDSGQYWLSYDTSALLGNYSMNCSINDTAGNQDNMTDNSFLVYTTTTTLPPTVTDCYMNQSSIFQGDNITFYLNYTMGSLDLDTGWFYYNSTPRTKVDSTANDSGQYWASYDTSALLGNYSMNCSINDTAGSQDNMTDNSFLVYTTTSTTSTTVNTTTTSTISVTTTIGGACNESGNYSRIKIDDLAFLGIEKYDVYCKSDGRYLRTINISNVNTFYDDVEYLIYPRARTEHYLGVESTDTIIYYAKSYLPQIIIFGILISVIIALGIVIIRGRRK